MARQFKLRLRDGTILAVDQGGLRTWLIDDKAMVQPMGTRGWRPLKEILAELSLAAAMKPPPAPAAPAPAAAPPPPVPARKTLAVEDIPSIPIKPPVLEAPGSDIVLDVPVEPAPAPPAPRPPAPPPARAAAPAAAAPPAASAPPPVARSRPAQPAASSAGTPAPRPPAPPAPRPAPPPAPPPAPAPAALAKAAPPRPVEPLIPEPPPEDAPPTIEDLPIIPFKALEEEPAPPRVSVRVAAADSQDETDLADQLALVIQREVAEGHAVVIREEDLEELDLVDEAGEAAHPQPPPPAAAVALASGLGRLVAWSAAAISSVRVKVGAAWPARTDPGPAARVAPPTPLSELPVVPLAAEPGGARPRRRRQVRLAGVAAAALAVAVAAGFGVSRWIAGREDARVAPPAAPPPPPVASEPELPPEVATAAQRLPQLAPDTIQLLLSTSPFANPEPSDLFRRARVAARRGVSALTPEEAHELTVLERAVLVRLAPAERERVMAYDRLRAGRDLLPAEDARVMALVARGARGLRADHRERLQVLSGKAIDAALAPAPSGSPPAAAGEAPRR